MTGLGVPYWRSRVLFAVSLLALLHVMSFRDILCYTAFYCEENAYLLLKGLVEGGHATPNEVAMIFISNPRKRVPVF